MSSMGLGKKRSLNVSDYHIQCQEKPLKLVKREYDSDYNDYTSQDTTSSRAQHIQPIRRHNNQGGGVEEASQLFSGDHNSVIRKGIIN
ncbi:unnamed protein product, partial [Oppiella nova]